MAGKKQPAPVEQLPPGDYIAQVVERLRAFKNDPIAKLGLAAALEAERIHRKELRRVIVAEIKSEE